MSILINSMRKVSQLIQYRLCSGAFVSLWKITRFAMKSLLQITKSCSVAIHRLLATKLCTWKYKHDVSE